MSEVIYPDRERDVRAAWRDGIIEPVSYSRSWYLLLFHV